MNGSLDTSVVLRLMLKDVPEQTREAATILRGAKAQLAVADVVFVEVAHVLERYYQLARGDIVTLLTGFMLLEIINCNRRLFDKVFDLFTAHPALSFEDCCLAVYAENSEALPLYTFDKKLARQLPQAQLVTT